MDYFVAADGKGTGFCETDPMSFHKIENYAFKSGDRLLLRCGDVFYGDLSPCVEQTSEEPFLVTSYGSGRRPEIRHAKVICRPWEPFDGEFYRFNLTDTTMFEGLKDSDDNVGFMEDSSGVKWGNRKENREACEERYEFFCDNGFIYVKTDRDPYEELGVLILGVNGHIVRLDSHMTVKGLHLHYGAGHGVVVKDPSVHHGVVCDCVIEDIGGSRLGNKGWTKYGNGIEFYCGASHMLVENNIIRNVYDVGFTVQGPVVCVWKDIVVRRNIFAYNTQSFETWTTGTEAHQGLDGVYFEDNVCINQGEGWGTPARPDLVGGGGQVKMTDVLVYAYFAPILKVSVKGNTFYNRNERNRVYSISTVGSAFLEKTEIDSNYVYLPRSSSVCMSTDNGDGKHRGKELPFAEWQTEYRHDQNSTFVAIGSKLDKYATLESLALTSLSFRDIVRALEDAGVVTNMEFG